MSVQTVAEAALSVKAEIDKASIAREGRAAGEVAGEELTRGIDGKLRDSKGRFAKSGEDSGNEFSRGFAKVMKGGGGGGAFGKVLATMAARATLAVGAVGALTPVVAKLTAALLPAAGVAVALPAAMLSIQAAAGVVKIAVNGVGDAIQSGLTGTSKEAAKALEALPPPARAFAREVIALKPQLKALRTEVARGFFAPLTDEVRPLAALYMPMLRHEMTATAGPLGGLGEEFARTARSADVFAAVRDLFTGTRLAAVNLRGAVAPLTTALAALIQTTAPELPRIASGFASMATKIGEFITRAVDSGRVLELYENGLNTFRQLGQILGNLGSIAVTVFRASNLSGAGLLDTLIGLTETALRFLRSAQGLSAMTAVFGTLASVGGTLRETLGKALPFIGEALAIAAPLVQQLAAQVGRLVVSIAPLLPSTTRLAVQIGTALLPVVSALASFLEANQRVLALLVPWVVAAYAAYRIYTITIIAVSAATKAWAVVQRLLNGTLLLNPIGIVVAALILLGVWVVHLWKTNQTFREVVLKVWAGIKQAIGGVVSWFVNTAVPWLKTAFQFAAKYVLIFVDYVRGQFNLWKGIVLGTVSVVIKTFNTVKTFITVTLPNAFRSGVAAITKFWDGLKEVARKPVAFVVNQIINPFLGGFRRVASVFGVKTPDPITGFAAGGRLDTEGGQIPGTPSDRDNRIGWLKNAAGRVVSNVAIATGEFVVNARDTAKALPLLRWINDGMRGGWSEATRRIGRRPVDRMGDGSEGWAFAGGGLVGFLKDVWGAISDPKKAIAGPINAVIDQIPGGGAVRDVLVGMGRKLISGFSSWLTGGAGGAAGGNVGAAQRFVKAQAGKPYIWASAGPGGYDCSGIVSAVYNVLKGRNPYGHTFSTGQLPGQWFREGVRVGPLVAGWAHPGQRGASSSVGHMAGMIGGLPFESTGSRGVHIGTSARKVGQFAHIGAAKHAGGVVELQRIAKVAKADYGSVTLAPGANLIYNGLGRPEPLGSSAPPAGQPGPPARLHPDDIQALAEAIGSVVGGNITGTVGLARTAARQAGRRGR